MASFVESTSTTPNILDPCYIHPNENSPLVLVSPVLDGPKNKFVFVDGTVNKLETTDSKYAAWKWFNVLVLSWINHGVSTKIASGILWISEAYSPWTELRNCFSQGDHSRIAQLHRDVYSIQQGDLTVSAYYSKLRMSWDELCVFCLILRCASITGCCCKTSKTVLKYQEDDSVLCFLQGLNDNYDQVRSHI